MASNRDRGGPAAAAPGGDPGHEQFRLLVESVRDYAIFMLDPTGHIETWNVGAERIKGYAAADIVGKHFSIFYPDEDVRAGKCEWELEVAGREGRFEDEGWRLRKDGTRFWANVVISAVRDRTGTLIGFSKVTRDLTDRRRAEEERAARLAAENASRMKDEFMAMLGHELRNPMAPIMTALHLMKLRNDGKSTREQEIVERQVRHMMRLIDDLLDISRITRGKIELQKRHLDVRDVVPRAIEVASPLLEQRRHHLEVDLPPDPIVVDGDEGRLTQVLINLLTNAARYTAPGGHIDLELRREAAEVIIEVRDDGFGIEARELGRIFEPFVQGPQAPDRASGGLGLGLALVRNLVGLHGGRVEARSPGAGRGSTFALHLPAIDAATAVPHPRPAITPIARTARARRILVVDDNDDVRTLMAEVLVSAGHQVESAGDPASALALLVRFAPEVCLLDIGLPVMDGYELAARIRELVPEPPRLIALTGYGRPHDRARSQQVGFDLHLVKPVDINRLLASVDG